MADGPGRPGIRPAMRLEASDLLGLWLSVPRAWDRMSQRRRRPRRVPPRIRRARDCAWMARNVHIQGRMEIVMYALHRFSEDVWRRAAIGLSLALALALVIPAAGSGAGRGAGEPAIVAGAGQPVGGAGPGGLGGRLPAPAHGHDRGGHRAGRDRGEGRELGVEFAGGQPRGAASVRRWRSRTGRNSRRSAT